MPRLKYNAEHGSAYNYLFTDENFNDIVIEVNRNLREDIMRFGFRQMKNEDISVFINEMFAILASNMSAVAPTGNSYDEDYKTWSESAVPAWREGKRSVILIFAKISCADSFNIS